VVLKNWKKPGADKLGKQTNPLNRETAPIRPKVTNTIPKGALAEPTGKNKDAFIITGRLVLIYRYGGVTDRLP
jgi:hypothetical protein